MPKPYDQHYMKAALALAARGLGRVSPNPSVGCVLVRVDGGRPRVVGRGWTQPGGRPHAETQSLDRAGEAARGATAYVSLEPCAHQGKTGPCAQALIDAGIARVVGAVSDPDPRVAGRGFAMLEKAGVAVEEGLCGDEARRLNAGFFLRVSESRPLVTLKIASTLDGRIATQTGHSQWITGEIARQRGHMMRATHDAIIVGSNTAIVDDPLLDCRIAGLADRTPIRIIADGHLRLPLTSKLVRAASHSPVWIMTLPGGDASRRSAFRDCGVELIDVPLGMEGSMDPGLMLKALADRGVTRLLVEGGARLASSFMRARLVDRLAWFVAPKLIGGDGQAALALLGVDRLDKAPHMVPQEVLRLGEDMLTTYIVRN